MVDNRRPVGSTTDGRTIEETYQKKTHVEHILLRPDTYIGSTVKHQQFMWVWEDDKMVKRDISYVPGLYRIFDVILLNAAGNKRRDPKMDTVKVNIDVEGNRISVFYNGDGLPVEIHQQEGVYVPELVFGHLLTSSDFDNLITGGSNGYGVELANIFSTEFTIETADGKRNRRYKQVFTNNMGKKSEPAITKCRIGDNWTRVSFKPDLVKFGMECLEKDVVALMKKRVVDLAGCLGKSVKVELDGKRVPPKTFEDYTKLYFPSDDALRIYEKVNERWEVCVSRSDGHFEQVSFINNIATIKGGTHVDYIANQVANHLVTAVKEQNKHVHPKAQSIKNHLWVFVNALIDNPTFDSQTQEHLTVQQSSFGSTCELTSEFLEKVAKSDIAKGIFKDPMTADGYNKAKLGIPSLKDANYAATEEDSDMCTLIVTKGDSARAFAMSILSVVGPNYYGVFPLRGKLLNVMEASPKQLQENTELQNIKKILGLQHGKTYDDVKSLRYSHLIIMADQDRDRSRIQGLLIKFLHVFWPSLLKVPEFVLEVITPIVNATSKKNNDIKLSFYTMPEYEAWKENLGYKAIEYEIKYYKAGTSLFDSKDEFINKELINLSSMADLQRSIPSMVDGLKPDQRKILFCAFKIDANSKFKVAQVVRYVYQLLGYHHDSLDETIIGMSQNFVGSNNINLFYPSDQSGTRQKGGKDHASGSDILTRPSPITPTLFHKEDEVLLYYSKNDYGRFSGPTWFIPIIPMVLVNGSEGTGTGLSTFVPNFNPRHIIDNLKRLLNGEPMVRMDPWYRRFKGTIQKTASKDIFVSTGIVEEKVGENTIRITELPIGRWTQEYQEFLEAGKNKEPFIKDYMVHNDDMNVHFEVTMGEDQLNKARREGGLLKMLDLTSTLNTSNMHLYDANGVIKKYDTPEQILEEFFHLRLNFYEKRKAYQVSLLKEATLRLENKARFSDEVVKGAFVVSNKKWHMVAELKRNGYTFFPKGGYRYLVSMIQETLTDEKTEQLREELGTKKAELDKLENTPLKSLWLADLDDLEKELDAQEERDVKEENDYRRNQRAVRRAKGSGGARKPTQAIAEPTETSVPSAKETDNVPTKKRGPEALKPMTDASPRRR